MRHKSRGFGERKHPKQQKQNTAASDSLRIYGYLPVLEALKAKPEKFRKIVVSQWRNDARIAELEESARRSGVPVNRVPSDELVRLVEEGANHQGVCAFVKPAEFIEKSELIRKALDSVSPTLLVLDGIEDPRNLGAIVRTAECAGVAGIFLPDKRAAGITEVAVKTAAGAADHVTFAHSGNISALLAELKEAGFWIVGASGDASAGYTDWDFSLPTAIVLGSEGKGIKRLTAENCDQLVKIPMYGKIESLNVSVAAGVLLFEAARQKALGKS